MWKAIEDGLCQAELVLPHLLEPYRSASRERSASNASEFLILAYQGDLGVKIIHFSEDKFTPF